MGCPSLFAYRVEECYLTPLEYFSLQQEKAANEAAAHARAEQVRTDSFLCFVCVFLWIKIVARFLVV